MSELITFGETMMVLSSPVTGMMRYSPYFIPKIAGAESNTAIGLCKLGHSAEWISSVGNDEIGKFVLNSIRSEGVCVSHTYIHPHRPTGIMFKEFRAEEETNVYYYRAGSAFTDFSVRNLKGICLDDCRIFHCTGITPMLSEKLRNTLMSLINMCLHKNIAVSFDPNIRLKLLNRNHDIPVIQKIIEKSTYLMMGVNEAEILLDINSPKKIADRFFHLAPCLKYLALKDSSRGAYIFSRDEHIFIPPHPCNCIDSIGAGDAFNAGFLAGILEDRPLEECGKIAAVCGALCTEVHSDTEGIPDRETLLRLLKHKTNICR